VANSGDKARVEKKAQSNAALDVPHGRSNFARKNATLPRLNHHKGIVLDFDQLVFDCRQVIVSDKFSLLAGVRYRSVFKDWYERE